jgi:hypothetical protein
MSGKTIFEDESPKTQSIDAVRALIAFYNHGQAPEELPDFFRLSGELVLVQSRKGNHYYVTTSRDCSCPAKHWQPGKPCKHQRKYFPAPKVTSSRADVGDESLMSREPFKPFLESDLNMEAV